jgi:hypothetical protein
MTFFSSSDLIFLFIYREAFSLVQQRRFCINPNEGPVFFKIDVVSQFIRIIVSHSSNSLNRICSTVKGIWTYLQSKLECNKQWSVLKGAKHLETEARQYRKWRCYGRVTRYPTWELIKTFRVCRTIFSWLFLEGIKQVIFKWFAIFLSRLPVQSFNPFIWRLIIQCSLGISTHLIFYVITPIRYGI